jgi:tryptophanyl-tRNA synthetase
MTQYKAGRRPGAVGDGLLQYPVPMADILIYQAHVVRSADQSQHLEFVHRAALQLALWRDVQMPPAPAIVARASGLDDPTKKMSKSAAGSVTRSPC